MHNPSGLHARPAAAFVRAACTFQSDIRVANMTTGSDPVTAKSIIGVLGLGVQRGHRIRLFVDGADEGPAADTLRALVEAGLGEDDLVDADLVDADRVEGDPGREPPITS